MISSILSSPVSLAIVAAILLVGMVLGYRLLSHLADNRAQLVREERARQDKARKDDAGDPILNALGKVLDPLDLTGHG